ncbi:MAG: O-antigen ligase family protein [Candidatus Levybacteria bacterium]|nr:O-antigen ligase family protein [Candidatus Levybacteria bacterium]
MKLIGFLDRSIEYLFYTLFLLIPLVFAGNTSELFEFNKMWLTFGIAILIGFFWFSKMILSKEFIFRRTIFDIPILLFLISQVVSTIISLDPHVSLWGYYSRWNGGLLSTITYIFLFYAFISNFSRAGGASGRDPDSAQASESSTSTGGRENERQDPRTKIVRRSLLVSLVSGFLVVLWALPSHFGYDPTCLIFRGTLDVSCWTADFQPRVRIFGPLGQPDWLAGYLGVLLPITGAFVINELRKTKELLNPRLVFYSILFVLFYISLLYSGSRSGIAGTILSLIFFFAFYAYLNRKNLEIIKVKFALFMALILLAATFFAGIELPNGSRFSYHDVIGRFQTKAPPPSQSKTVSEDIPTSSIPLGGSSSFQIRSIVWRGGLAAWRANPIIGTGVETFAFAYYKFRPIEHNSVSEWNFLYNKAHNEYLNYLATTGIFGLGSYLLFIVVLLIVALVNLLNIRIGRIKYLGQFLATSKWDHEDPLILALTSSFLAILIINFFGFSVVIMNIYLFLIPAFMLIMLDLIKYIKPLQSPKFLYISYGQWAGVAVLGIVATFMVWTLIRFWIADTKYALGFNYNQAGDFQTAYPLLQDAVRMRKEPVFLNEMAVNDAYIAVTLASQNASESANVVQSVAQQAIDTTDKLTRQYPHNVVFWKTRVRVLYTLARIDPNFYPAALAAIQRAAELAPTDASILYNLGVLYGQNNDSKKAIEILEKTVSYRPHYTEAHFALGLFYHDLGVDQNGKIKDAAYLQKAISEMEYILTNLNPKDPQAKEYLETWQKEK